MSAHTSRLWDLVSILELAEQEVSLQVNTELAANQPLETNFFSGILEGVAGRFGLVPPGVTDPPASEWVYHDNGQPPSERLSRRWRGGTLVWGWSPMTCYLPDFA